MLSCRACIEWTECLEKVKTVLADSFSSCDDCEQQATMRTIANQFRMRLPRWWVVNNVVVVPIWIVELLRQGTAI